MMTFAPPKLGCGDLEGEMMWHLHEDAEVARAPLTPDSRLTSNPHPMFAGTNSKVQFKSANSKYEGLFVRGYGRNALKPQRTGQV